MKVIPKFQNPAGGINPGYKTQPGYQGKRFPDGTIMPMTQEEFMAFNKDKDMNSVVPNEALSPELQNKGITWDQLYRNYRSWVTSENDKILKSKRDIEARRIQDYGFRPHGGSDYTDGLFTAFGKPLVGAMMLPAASMLASTGALSTIGGAVSDATPWVAKNIVLPYLGGKVVDEGLKLTTGNDWRTTVRNGLMYYGVPENWADAAGIISNPSYWTPWSKVAPLVDRGIQAATYPIKQRILNAAYENITPMGYGSMPWASKSEELLRTAKDVFLNPKSHNYAPHMTKWQKSFLKYLNKNPELWTEKAAGDATLPEIMSYRDEAWRLATNQYTNKGLYLPNADDTYRYNMDVVKSMKASGTPVLSDPVYMTKHPNGKISGPDFVTTNGGTVGIKLKDITPPMNWVNNGEYHFTPEVNMHDIWDLMPLQKLSPILSKFSSKLGIRTPKIIGINKDILEPLGGGFTLNHTIPEGEVNVITKPPLSRNFNNIFKINY